jgi:hypothetical protein
MHAVDIVALELPIDGMTREFAGYCELFKRKIIACFDVMGLGHASYSSLLYLRSSRPVMLDDVT